MLGIPSDSLTAIVSGAISLATTVVTMLAAHRRQRRRDEERRQHQEASIQKLALEQSEHAFESIRADVDRYRADVDRLTRLVDQYAARLREVEAELAAERDARRAAEARVQDLARQLGERKE